jgi:hypothetical protein
MVRSKVFKVNNSGGNRAKSGGSLWKKTSFYMKKNICLLCVETTDLEWLVYTGNHQEERARSSNPRKKNPLIQKM